MDLTVDRTSICYGYLVWFSLCVREEGRIDVKLDRGDHAGLGLHDLASQHPFRLVNELLDISAWVVLDWLRTMFLRLNWVLFSLAYTILSRNSHFVTGIECL